jgi:hypothetical protein
VYAHVRLRRPLWVFVLVTLAHGATLEGSFAPEKASQPDFHDIHFQMFQVPTQGRHTATLSRTLSNYLNNCLLGRWTAPEEVAMSVVYLASEISTVSQGTSCGPTAVVNP